jgi:hypothetical protein
MASSDAGQHPPTLGRSYAPGSAERASTVATLEWVRTAGFDIPNVAGGEDVRTGRTAHVVIPHAHAQEFGQVHYAGGH